MAPYKITLDGICVIEMKILNIFTFLYISNNWHIRPTILRTVIIWSSIRKKKRINLKVVLKNAKQIKSPNEN